MKRLAFLTLLIGGLFTTNAFAGGGSQPHTYQELQEKAELIQTLISFAENGAPAGDSWYEDHCEFWTNLTDWIQNYMTIESDIRARTTLFRTTYYYKIQLAHATGENTHLIPVWTVRRQHAQNMLNQMAAWHNQFHNYYNQVGWSLRNYYCSADQICEPSEPIAYATGKAYVYKTDPTGTVVNFGAQQTLFSFALTLDDVEDGQLEALTVSVYTPDSSNYYAFINCTLVAMEEPYSTQAYAGSPIYNPLNNSSTLSFKLSDPFEIAEGETQHFAIRCDVHLTTSQTTTFTIGFMPMLDTSPIEAINVTGISSGEDLPVEPDMYISEKHQIIP